MIKKIKTKISKIINITSEIKEFRFKLNDEFNFYSGQFVNLSTIINNIKVKRAYSICSSSNLKDEIHLCIKRVENGKLTSYLWEEDILEKEFEIMGPLGINNITKFTHNKIYLICVGVGIAPIKSIISSIIKKSSYQINLIYGNKFDAEIPYKLEFDELEKNNSNLKIRYVISRTENTKFKKGYVQNHLENFDFNDSDIFICGMEKMVDDTKKTIIKQNPNNVNFFEEKF